jgi:hypothetical protein
MILKLVRTYLISGIDSILKTRQTAGQLGMAGGVMDISEALEDTEGECVQDANEGEQRL